MFMKLIHLITCCVCLIPTMNWAHSDTHTTTTKLERKVNSIDTKIKHLNFQLEIIRSEEANENLQRFNPANKDPGRQMDVKK